MIIEDGTGKGYKVHVNEENCLCAKSITVPFEHHANQDHGQFYSIVLDQAPTAGDDCILYLINNDDDDLLISSIAIFASGAAEVYMKLGSTGTRNGAAALTPVNRNAGSGNVADCTCEQGADLDGGAATLTGGDEVERIAVEANKQTFKFEWCSAIIIPKNQTMTLWASAIVTVNATIGVYFYESC